MELFLGEHGEALLYGIVGTIMVIVVCMICGGKWNQITPEYKVKTNKSNGDFIINNSGKFPTIEVDEIIYADYKDDKFDFRDFISAKDFQGKDITNNLHTYGNVDVFKKGIYKIRCVVVADNQLACTKYVNVIVE